MRLMIELSKSRRSPRRSSTEATAVTASRSRAEIAISVRRQDSMEPPRGKRMTISQQQAEAINAESDGEMEDDISFSGFPD